MTKDERYLVELYKKSLEKRPVDPILVGQALGFSPRQIKTILKDLFKTNLIKKIDDETIILTPQAEKIAKALL